MYDFIINIYDSELQTEEARYNAESFGRQRCSATASINSTESTDSLSDDRLQCVYRQIVLDEWYTGR